MIYNPSNSMRFVHVFLHPKLTVPIPVEGHGVFPALFFIFNNNPSPETRYIIGRWIDFLRNIINDEIRFIHTYIMREFSERRILTGCGLRE